MNAEINKEIPWAFFDGASQWEPPLGGAGAVIFFPSTKKMKIKFATGQASNNKAELSALWETLKVEKNIHIQEIKMYGDSKVVIDWANEKSTIRAPHLQHLLAEIQTLKLSFIWISFGHVYRELNMEANALSKEALAYQPDLMETEEVLDGTSTMHYETL